MRMKDSFWQIDDKKTKQPNSLFNDANFNDKDFHNKYPTIHHLIKAFIDGEKIDDIRLLYLACHNMIKKRGHFLFKDQGFDTKDQIAGALKELFEFMSQDLELENNWTEHTSELEEILTNKKYRPSEKERKIRGILQLATKDKQQLAIIKLSLGLTANFADLFADEELKESSPKSIAFSKIDFDAKADESIGVLGEDRFELILKSKGVYNGIILDSILTGETYLSYAKVATYEKHKADLKILKEVVKNISESAYKSFFKDEKTKDNYVAYIGLNSNKGRKRDINKKSPKEDFYKFIKTFLEKNDEKIIEKNLTKRKDKILSEIELDNFLPLQVDKKNSEIPYQLRKAELEEILTSASNNFDFLNKKDEKNWSIAEKIISLLEFKIPYYIGITNDFNKSKFPDRCWVIKKENAPDGELTPWNFEYKIDKEATAEAFIGVRTNKCSYLIGEDVLPRHSLIYSEFTVLNEINNLKIYDAKGEDIFNLDLKKEFMQVCLNKKKK